MLKFRVVIYNRFVAKRFAWFTPKTDTITLNPALAAASVEEIELVMTHELLHVAQKALKHKVDHGPSFRAIAKQFGIPRVSTTAKCANDIVRHPRVMRAALGVKK